MCHMCARGRVTFIRLVFTGLIAVGMSAAVLSFTALAGLAGLAGVNGHAGPVRLAWLFPVCVDAYAVTGTLVWLRVGLSAGTRDWARANALAAIALSMAGNAAYHVDPSQARSWVVGAVTAVPPLMLGAAVHTAVLVMRDRSRSAARAESRSQSRPKESRPGPAVSVRPVSGGTPTRLELVSAKPGSAEAVMRAHWDRERAAGRTPTGAELDKVGGTKDGYGRKLIRKWAAEQPTVAEASR